LLERGRSWNSAGEKDKAKQVFLRAFDAGKRAGNDYLTVDAAHMIAIVEEPEQALEWNLLGFRILEDTKQEHARHWIGSLSNNIAWTYHDMGDYEAALDYFEKGRDFRAQERKEPGYRISLWAVARCKRSMGRVQEALDEQFAIRDNYYPSFDPGIHDGAEVDGYLPEEIGECLLALGREEEAKPYFAAAHKLLSKDEWLVENEPERIERLKRLGH
ncbi:MAG TPA: tetratricopeptide repeat protein, partial [Fimbriimonadaceae bacterium]|nr:tetratricopeptide repeat protein [Fimbriimonadaceae bacterium]